MMQTTDRFIMLRRNLRHVLLVAFMLVLFTCMTVLSFDSHSQASASYLQMVAGTTATKVPYGDGNPMPPVSWCPSCSI